MTVPAVFALDCCGECFDAGGAMPSHVDALKRCAKARASVKLETGEGQI